MNSIRTIKVRNLVGLNNNPVSNQFMIDAPEGKYFQSYQTIIIFWDNDGSVTLDEDSWDYSVTTGKYRNLLLGEKKVQTERKIKSGEYKLVNLNG